MEYCCGRLSLTSPIWSAARPGATNVTDRRRKRTGCLHSSIGYLSPITMSGGITQRQSIPTHTSLPPCSQPSRTNPLGGRKRRPSLTAAARDGRTIVRVGTEDMAPPGAEPKNGSSQEDTMPSPNMLSAQARNCPRNRGKSRTSIFAAGHTRAFGSFRCRRS
jgi:hypothetical protein